MYSNTGYFNLTYSQLGDQTIPLRLNCCGVYRLTSRPSLYTARPNGYPDFQLLYIASGKARFSDNSTKNALEVSAGHMVLYQPGEPQDYIYFLEDSPEVYWVHFTGYEAAQLLSDAGFSLGETFGSHRILHTGTSSGYQQLFLSMIREIQLPRPCCQEMSALYFRELLCLIRRQKAQGLAKNQIQKEIEDAAHFLHENYAKDFSVAAYAGDLHISTCWFIRSFKRYIGMSPAQYLTSIRMDKAKELLESTDFPVSEIAEIIGYQNPLYFSRIFKSRTGQSPTEYRGKRRV